MPQPYEKVAEFEHPWEEVFRAAQTCIQGFPKMALLVADRATGRVVAFQAVTLRSFGATVVVDVGHVSAGRTRVRVWSAIAGLYDLLGKNKSNVNAILRAIDEELSGATT